MPEAKRSDPATEAEIFRGELKLARATNKEALLRLKKNVLLAMVTRRIQEQGPQSVASSSSGFSGDGSSQWSGGQTSTSISSSFSGLASLTRAKLIEKLLDVVGVLFFVNLFNQFLTS